MRVGLVWLMAWFLMAGSVMADPGPPQTYYVRYSINMDFLPPLIGERRCISAKPCDIVRLQQLTLTLTAPSRQFYGMGGTIEIDCMGGRECAVGDGKRELNFDNPKHTVGFFVTDRINPLYQQLVIKTKNEIGEILLAY